MHAGEKGFHAPKISENFLKRRKPLIKKILTPTLIAVTNQSHQLTGSVQGERPRTPRQLKSSFFRSAIAFAVVALIAAGHQVLPGRPPASRARHYMVQGQLRAGEHSTAELTRVAVSQQYVFSRKRPALLRNVAVRQQPNYGWNAMRVRR